MIAKHAPGITERFRRLTPREMQVLLFLLEGTMSTQEIADLVGASRGVISGVRQSIRRKLGVPRHADLRDFVDSVPGLRQYAHAGATASRIEPRAVDRRRHLVLRAALRDTQALAIRLKARAEALRALAGDDSVDGELARAEADAVETLALHLHEVFAAGVARSRSNDSLLHQLAVGTDPRPPTLTSTA